ncbi:carbonic anhydrase [Diplodia corticola]|uniref:Carbonic anhydrase n=1 Tax=Diplodia corticola TaxID=236234 RepID=A0A1J9S0Z8_9PEZI|nr:carbonic anhydrase [Diplodia corticola]OJD33700.1 carbonic anhydrase [Diplodia corticola]
MLSNILPVALLLSSVSASCLHGTSLMPRRLNKRAEVEVSNYGYTGLTGPLNWHNIEAGNELCNHGSNQSPINLDSTVTLATEAPSVNITNVESAEFENLGTTLETIVNGTTFVGGEAFNLAQFHLHTPSEHRIENEYFPLEMHMVHEAADDSGKIVVLAVLFQLSEDGATTDLLSAATQNIAEVEVPGSVTETAALDFAPLAQHLQETPLLTYTGSLTTPPCTEDVTFLITQEPMPLNVATYNKIKSVMKFNARFSQNSLGLTNLLDQTALAGLAIA